MKRTHCKNGHAFTPENTRMRGGGRVCLRCAKINDARYRAKKNHGKPKRMSQTAEERKARICFCSRRWHERMRQDPERWALYLARMRAKGKHLDPEKVRARGRRKDRQLRSDPVRGPLFRAKRAAQERARRAKNPERYRETERRYRERRKATGKTETVDQRHRLYEAVMQAVPRHYPPDVRDDIAGAIFLAVLEGQVRQRDIAKRVKEYATKHYRQFDQFKNVSLDATVPGTESLRLIDTIAADAPHF